jgi:predicted dehydrogenase
MGLGWAGQRHLEAYEALPGARVVALAGLEEPARQELAARFGVERDVARWEDVLALDDLDAVSIAVPTFLHAPIAIAALERGLHVLCEKPIARNADEADAMVAAARDADRVLDIAFNHRQRGDIQALKAAIDAGRVGRPYYAKAWWLRRTGIPTLGSWFTQSDLAGGGPLVDIGIHVLDYALFLLGNPEVRAVSASTYDLLATAGFGSSPDSNKTGATDAKKFDVEDLASVFIRLADGGTLLVEASWAAHRRDGDEFGVTLYGTDGGAELIVDDLAPVGSLRIFGDDGGAPVAMRLRPQRGRGHIAVVEQFLDKVRSGDWQGTTAQPPQASPG